MMDGGAIHPTVVVAGDITRRVVLAATDEFENHELTKLLDELCSLRKLFVKCRVDGATTFDMCIWQLSEVLDAAAAGCSLRRTLKQMVAVTSDVTDDCVWL